MSSTNRSNARDNHISDYYITPIEPIKMFITEFIKDENISDLSELTILDPCAWWDAQHPMSYPTALQCSMVTNDIREDSPAEYHSDFLKWYLQGKFDIVITNPPFNIAQEIIEKSLSISNKYVIMLLRLNYMGSKSRSIFWNTYKPYAIYVHNKRMSFTEDNKTDSIEYAHFVWKKWYNPEFAKLKILHQ